MVPWPIALLTIGYTALATASAASMWQGHASGSLLWRGGWTVGMLALVIGLAFLRPWARRLAIGLSMVLMASALVLAFLAVIGERPDPHQSLLATGAAAVQLLVIRYLTRPHVRAWFAPVAKWQGGKAVR